MSQGPILETERLILRPTTIEDLDGMEEFCADPETMRFVGGEAKTRAEAFRILCGFAGAWTLTGISMFSVIEKQGGRWIGRVGPWRPEGWPGNEVGWGIVRSAEGQGYATEAAAASMDYAVDQLGWERIIHVIVKENLPSIALAKRLGSTLLGPTKLPAPFADLEIDAWGQTADQWAVNRQKFA